MLGDGAKQSGPLTRESGGPSQAGCTADRSNTVSQIFRLIQEVMMITLKQHFEKMQDMSRRYIEPIDYVDRDGYISGNSSSEERHAFLGDIIYMLDGPEQREAQMDDQWDVSVRGPRMSEASGWVIFKYQMPVLERFEMTLPAGAQIIRMEDQGGMFWMWAVVNTDNPPEVRHFHAYKTGAAMSNRGKLEYVGFCKVFVQMELGLYIFEEAP